MQLETISAVMKDASLCGLGQTAPNPFISALKISVRNSKNISSTGNAGQIYAADSEPS